MQFAQMTYSSHNLTASHSNDRVLILTLRVFQENPINVLWPVVIYRVVKDCCMPGVCDCVNVRHEHQHQQQQQPSLITVAGYLSNAAHAYQFVSVCKSETRTDSHAVIISYTADVMRSYLYLVITWRWSELRRSTHVSSPIIPPHFDNESILACTIFTSISLRWHYVVTLTIVLKTHDASLAAFVFFYLSMLSTSAIMQLCNYAVFVT